MGNEWNLVEYGSILASIDESTSDDESDEGYIRMNNCEDISYEICFHPDNNTRYARLKKSLLY